MQLTYIDKAGKRHVLIEKFAMNITASKASVSEIVYVSVDTADVTTSVHHPATMIPSFTVSSNYPNPFKGKTSFDINLMKSSDVSVEVSNMLGEVLSMNKRSSRAPAPTRDWRRSARQGTPARRLRCGAAVGAWREDRELGRSIAVGSVSPGESLFAF